MKSATLSTIVFLLLTCYYCDDYHDILSTDLDIVALVVAKLVVADAVSSLLYIGDDVHFAIIFSTLPSS